MLARSPMHDDLLRWCHLDFILLITTDLSKIKNLYLFCAFALWICCFLKALSAFACSRARTDSSLSCRRLWANSTFILAFSSRVRIRSNFACSLQTGNSTCRLELLTLNWSKKYHLNILKTLNSDRPLEFCNFLYENTLRMNGRIESCERILNQGFEGRNFLARKTRLL